ncbi:hypothetical protein RN001_015732 [Aquatica leii]|uniref:Major facilitator superfamily (MFS) profile domain-containing protein n=1 Tax=Aquatica leii TaxID=1421715 RepID=A0AAN7QAT1_9COLE|nr:hypothetical protein RN001_015732 [Aquatica leii]
MPCPEKSSFTQIVLGLIANFTSLSPSMSLGFSAIALPWLLAHDNPYKLTKNESSWFASIVSTATPIGCLISGPISDRYGRKTALLNVNVVCALGWLVIVSAFYVQQHQYQLLLLGRVLTGLSSGLCSMPATIYMAEVSTPKLRGMFITWNALTFALGVLLIYLFGSVAQDNWGATAMICAALPCMGLFMTCIYMVESPLWLASKNRLDEAKLSMRKFYNCKECSEKVDAEIEMQLSNVDTKEKLSFAEFLRPTFIKPFLLISTFFFFQQFSGVFVIIFYAIDIVNQVKISINPYVAICSIAFVRIIGSVIVSFLNKKFGRRPLSLVSGGGMTVSMIAIAVYLISIQENIIAPMSMLPLTLLIGYIFFCSLGFFTMPFAMAAEVFPSKVRGIGTGLTTCIAYICNFVIIKIYPLVIKKISNYNMFLLFGCVSLLGTMFVALCLPETNGKTLKEIEEYFDKKNKYVGNESKISQVTNKAPVS